jgi:hypothetical protein
VCGGTFSFFGSMNLESPSIATIRVNKLKEKAVATSEGGMTGAIGPKN